MRRYFLILLILCLTLLFSGCSLSKSTGNQEKEIQSDILTEDTDMTMDLGEDKDEEKSISFKLLPEDADLSMAPDVVVEPDKAPYNLGGWTEDSVVFWEVELPEDGRYSFKITYSRPGSYPTAWGILRVETADGEIHDLNFSADPTGKAKNRDEWSVYVTKDAIGDNLTAGIAIISVIPNYDFEPSDDMPDYFINLRSIDVTCTPYKDSKLSKDEQANEETQPSYIEQDNEDTPSSYIKKEELKNSYKIIIDGGNVTENMALTIQNDVLYAEASSYFDSLTFYGNPILYCDYDKDQGVIGVYSWATDVMIMYFQVGNSIGYRYEDGMNDEWNEIILDAEISVDSENNALVPVKAMTEYLTSTGTLEADVQE